MIKNDVKPALWTGLEEAFKANPQRQVIVRGVCYTRQSHLAERVEGVLRKGMRRGYHQSCCCLRGLVGKYAKPALWTGLKEAFRASPQQQVGILSH